MHGDTKDNQAEHRFGNHLGKLQERKGMLRLERRLSLLH
jgi:hypothetical protein